MKKVFTPLAFLLALSGIITAQTAITLAVDDIADAGDIYVVSNGNLLEDYSLDFTGENVTWDYSFLTPTIQDSVVWLEPTETNVAYFLLWFTSDVAEESGQEFSSDFFSIEDIFNFYDRSSSELALTGFAGTISGIPLPAGYSDPDVIYDFPLTYGSNYSSASGFTFGIPGFGTWQEDKVRTCDADGWGTVITPFGSFETVRLHCELNINDVFEYSGFEIPISYITHEYRWMAENMGIPVLQINTQEFFGFETVSGVIYQDTLIAEPVAIEENLIRADIIVQNPVSANMQIAVTTDASHTLQCIVQDLNGAVVLETPKEPMHTGQNIFSYSTAQLQTGMYLVNVMLDDKLAGVKQLVVLQ